MTTSKVTSLTTAVLLAALVPAALFPIMTGSLGAMPIAFAIALVHSLVLGLPSFLVLQKFGRANGVSAGGAGFVIGCVPVGIYLWPLRLANSGSSSWIGPERLPTMIEGVPTMAGWLIYLEMLAQFGGLGIAGGLVFWAAMKRLTPSLVGSTDRSDSHVASAERSVKYERVGSFAFVGAVALSIGVFFIPIAMKDRSCHNVFRDGRSHISSELNIDLQISEDEWPTLVAVFQSFAEDHSLSFRDSSEVIPGTVHTLYLSLCNDSGVSISTVEQRWASMDFKNFAQGWGVAISFYKVEEEADWQFLAREMIARLTKQWPDKVLFRDGGGNVTQMPDDLASE